MKEYFLGVLKRDFCVYNRNNSSCVNWKKNRRDALLNGVEKIDGNFKYGKFRMNKSSIKQRNRYLSPKHETIYHLENASIFELENYNNQEFAEACAAGLYDVNRLRNRWNRDLTPDEIVREKEIVTVFGG